MGDLFVVAEHIRGEFKEITFEMLHQGCTMAEALGGQLHAVFLGHQVDPLAQGLKGWAHKVLVVDDPQLENFNSASFIRTASSAA